ncbi:50S ribosomal protein L3 [Candidatus Woesebacteria bacterium]|nr:50S ribosomal protein L3 [Candidatus Woesebacteria bacterium]
MFGFILGTKSVQDQRFSETGDLTPVTHITTSLCYLVDIKTQERDGYNALVIGFRQGKNIAKPQQGLLKKAGITTPLRFFREFRLDHIAPFIEFVEEGKKRGIKMSETQLFIGDEIKPSMMFAHGDVVDVSGTSKGKGFQGVVRRHGFAGGPRTHGQSDRERAPGSIGSGTTPGRVKKGMRMAGRMGGNRITVQGLTVQEVADDEIVVTGLVAGHKGALLEVRKSKI